MVFHQPDDGVDRLLHFVHPVGCPELGFDGPAIAVPNILGNDDHLTLFIQCGPAVHQRNQKFVFFGGEGVILGLVKIGGLQGYGGAILSGNDIGIIMENGYIVLSVMFGVGQGGFAGSGKSEDPHHISASVPADHFFKTSVAAGITIPVGQSPGQGQGPFFKFSEIPHAQQTGAVVFRIEIGQSIGVIGMDEFGIGQDVDVRFIAHRSGIPVHVIIGIVEVLEIEQPVVQRLFKSLRHQQMGFDDKVLVQADIRFSVIHFFKSGMISGFS